MKLKVQETIIGTLVTDGATTILFNGGAYGKPKLVWGKGSLVPIDYPERFAPKSGKWETVSERKEYFRNFVNAEPVTV